MKALGLTLLLVALAAPVFGQLRGKDAPDFSLGESVTTQPEKKTLEDCRGEVVMFDIWGVS